MVDLYLCLNEAVRDDQYHVYIQVTTQNVQVELTYNPGNVAYDERLILLGELLAFPQDQESTHGNWFLKNLVRVTDTDGPRDILMSIL